MIDLHNGQITDLLNNGMRYNPETIAIGYAILQEKRRIMNLADRTRLMSDVKKLDEKILDYLAVELRTPAYNDTFPINIKRELIAGTFSFYTRLGTPAAINWVIQAIFGEGKIEEWFQYGGEPGYFRVRSSSPVLASGGVSEFLRILESVKRLSAWLEVIILEITGPPFEEKPGELFFRRFIVSSVLPVHPLGICLSSILWGGIRFSHFQGSVRFDGVEDFDGGINFDQTFGAIPFRKFVVHAPFYSSSEELLSAALAVRFTFRRRNSVRFDSQTSFDGSICFDQDLGYRLRFQRFLYNAAFRHREKSSIPFDGEGSFDGSLDFNQRYGAVGFPRVKFNIRNFVSERVSSGFLFRHAFHRRFSARLDGSAGFDGTLDFDQAYGNRVMFPECRFESAFVHEKNHGGSSPPVLRVSAGFRETKKPAVLASFSIAGAVSEQNRLALSTFSVSGAKAPRHPGALTGQITMDNWQVLDGSAKLDGTFKLDAYLRQEGI